MRPVHGGATAQDFEAALRSCRTALMSLISAVGTGEFLDSWLASMRLVTTLGLAEAITERLPNITDARQRLDRVRSIAELMLKLSPRSIDIVCPRGKYSGGAKDDRAVQNWRRAVLQLRFPRLMHLVQCEESLPAQRRQNEQ